MVKIEHYTVLRRQRRIVNGRFNLQEALLPQITVQQNLHHCQKSTSSRYYRLNRLHVRSMDLIDRPDRFQGLPADHIISQLAGCGVAGATVGSRLHRHWPITPSPSTPGTHTHRRRIDKYLQFYIHYLPIKQLVLLPVVPLWHTYTESIPPKWHLTVSICSAVFLGIII